MANSSGHPRARGERLLTSDVDGELVVYDLDSDEAHLLNGPLASVWRLCDGSRSVETIATAVGGPASDESLQLTRLALEELQAAGLLASAPAPSGGSRMSRRDLLIKLGVGAAAVPTILTLAAAPALAACPPSCTIDSNCINASGCNAGLCCPAGSVKQFTCKNSIPSCG